MHNLFYGLLSLSIIFGLIKYFPKLVVISIGICFLGGVLFLGAVFVNYQMELSAQAEAKHQEIMKQTAEREAIKAAEVAQEAKLARAAREFERAFQSLSDFHVAPQPSWSPNIKPVPNFQSEPKSPQTWYASNQ
jgi:hypothetical protein